MTTDLFDLTGKIALVTGGSRGLGLQMVRAFAEHGADVIVASRKLDACEAAARRGSRHGPPRPGHLGPRRPLGRDR
jgi:NAD(P)-dependent dehydrogenase (short-subunit alcohol dehydrogenase family)